MKYLNIFVVALWFSCFSGSDQSAVEPATEITEHASETVSPLDSSTINIATFNIRILGKTKANKPAVMNRIATIMQQYDLICVQEIKDKTSSSADSLLAWLNRSMPIYAMLLSERTGTQPNDENSQEQYAYYYRTATISVLDSGILYPDSSWDLFQREPFVARFKAAQGNFTFAMVTIHTRPKAALEEIAALDSVNQWISARFPEEDDIITLGDFNAGCNYASSAQLNALSIRSDAYQWIVPDSANTNLSNKHCAYDRIVITNGAVDDYTGNWGVDRSFNDPAISDHWPVWASFYRNRD